jgi:hypothetical protein
LLTHRKIVKQQWAILQLHRDENKLLFWRDDDDDIDDYDDDDDDDDINDYDDDDDDDDDIDDYDDDVCFVLDYHPEL